MLAHLTIRSSAALSFFTSLMLFSFLSASTVSAPVSSASTSTAPVRFTNVVPASLTTNLVPNGSFEAGAAGWSSLGRGAGFQNAWAPLVDNWGNFAALHGAVEKSGGADGRAFLRIRLGGENTPVFNFDYFYPVNRRELRPLAANLGWIEVTPGQPYTFSVMMRASRAGVRAALGVQNEDAGQGWAGARAELLKTVTLTTGWKRYTHTFTPKYPFLFVLAGPDLEREENVDVDLDAVQLEQGSQPGAFTPRTPLEIGILPTAPCGVFTAGEPAALQVTAYNSASSPARAQIRFKATDFFDQPATLPALSLEVPAHSTLEKRLPLPASWRGFYRVQAETITGNSASSPESHLLRLAIVPPHTTNETVIGVNHAYSNSLLISLAKKAGVSWYRDWSLKWQHIEPERGRRRWEISDPQMNRVREQSVNLMAMIPFPSADWNSTAPDLATLRAASPRYRSGGQGDDQELIPRARWAWLPRDVRELTDFIGASIGRYKEQVQVWEFLNEPLFTTYSLPDADVLKTTSTAIRTYTVRDYLDLLKAAAPAIRAANPRARIMGGPGMWSGGKYTIPMVEAGLLDYVDIFGIHNYPGTGQPEGIIRANDKLLAAMKAHGGVKPIWMTEFSYFGTDDLPRQPFVPIPGLFSEPKLLSEKQVADYIIRFCTIFLGRGGERVFLHSGCTGSVNKPGTESCLFADGAVRKIYPALAVFTELLGANPKFVADRSEGGGFVFAFETGRHAVLVLWDPAEEATATLPSGLQCLNLMGQEIKKRSVHLTASPIYLIAPAGQARETFAACAKAIRD